VRISIVIPAYNEQQLLGGTLKAVQKAAHAFTRRSWQTELIVCDNNSTDATAGIAAAAGATVVHEPVRQIARARNRGARAATGDWLVFLDADSQPDTPLFEDVARHMNDPGVLAGGSTLRMDTNHWLGQCALACWNLASRCGKWLAGAFIFVRTEAFHTVGGFNEDLYAAEEIDLTRRLRTLARTRHQRIVILHRHPLLTSARKLHLYTPAELLRFWLRAACHHRQTVTDREACFLWYDGRR
jgi:glycosyltransferase involved in cell wall biosynthesis